MSLKDKLLDLSAHNWLHIAAAVCIGILLYQNHQQKLLIEQQAANGRELSARVIRDTGAAVGLFLHETLLHPYQIKQGEHTCGFGSKNAPRPGYQQSTFMRYSYALPEEVGQELLSRETQFRDKLAEDLFQFRSVQPEWHFSLREGIHPELLDTPLGINSCANNPLPPGYKWYTAEIEFSFPEFPVTD